MSQLNPSPLPPATTTKRGTMSAADKQKLDAQSGINTGDVTVSSPAGWLSLAGQALTFALVAASNTASGVVTAVAQTIAGGKRGAVVALSSSGGSIAVDLASANNYSHTTSENTTLAAPSNAVAGQHGAIVITQGATPRTLGFNSAWKFAGGTVPALTASAGAVDVLTYYVSASGFVVAALLKDVK